MAHYTTRDEVKALIQGKLADPDDASDNALIDQAINAVEASIDRITGFEFSRADATNTWREKNIPYHMRWHELQHTLADSTGAPLIDAVEKWDGDSWETVEGTIQKRYTESGKYVEWTTAEYCVDPGFYRVSARWGWAAADVPDGIKQAAQIQAAYRLQRIQSVAGNAGVVGFVGGVETQKWRWQPDAYDEVWAFRSHRKYGVIS